MLTKSFSALAVLALAVHVAAEPAPYKPMIMKTSVRQLFGVVRRDDTPGYQPTQAVCGDGLTCEEACGAGYTTCASTDEEVHCYNPAAAEICCPNESGNSCDAGYYCTSDNEGETWCCPNNLDVKACAAAYDITGGLVKQTPKPATSSTSAPAAKITPPVKNSTLTAHESDVSSSYTSTVVPSAGWPSSNTTSFSHVGQPTPSATTTSKIQQGAGNQVAPAGVLALAAAGLAALL
jgi:hypothetical protein